MGDIPKILFQTISDKTLIPPKVWTNIKQFAPNYDHRVFDDKESVAFLKDNYPPEVVQLYNAFETGAFKADLFRYCILYKFGGVYLDIKTELIMPLDDILIYNGGLYTVEMKDEKTGKLKIYNGIIAAIVHHEIFPVLIQNMLKIGPKPNDYHAFCSDFFEELSKRQLITFPGGKFGNYVLFAEIVSRDPKDCYDGLDRYGLCNYVYDPIAGKNIIKSRYADYPWKKKMCNGWFIFLVVLIPLLLMVCLCKK
jgi:hypothetical protein